jgi:Nif-specific regulatory protein
MAPRSANRDAAHAGTATDPTSAAGPSSEGVPSAIGPRISERERLIEAMERSGWVQAKAARMLGLTSRQVGYALKKHGIEIKHF